MKRLQNGAFSGLIGDRAFYGIALAVALPMVLQNLLTTFVGLLDNIMVGRIGTLQMSGVTIVNQLIFVFNLCIFGICSGGGIFTAQFAGKGDMEGVRHTMRYKLEAVLLVSIGAVALLAASGDPLCALFLTESDAAADREAVMGFAGQYLRMMLWGMLPFGLSNVYASMMRENGETMVPMISGMIAVGLNLVLNWVLIFGHLGAPVMGVTGAALATVISRWAEVALNAVWLHRHSAAHAYITGVYRSPAIPRALLISILKRGLPLVFNELFWSLGYTVLTRCYSTRGLEVVAAYSITSTINNLFSVCYRCTGSAVGIIIGRQLGAGLQEPELRDNARKLIAFSVGCCLLFALGMAACAGLFPTFYNTTESVMALATVLIVITAAQMPFCAYNNCAYFILRAGGQTLVTILFDSAFVWVVIVPVALVLTEFTSLPIIPVYAAAMVTELFKCGMGAGWLRSGAWIRDLTQVT